MIKININTAKEVLPQCYAYTTPGVSYHEGWTKIGYTERDVATRIKEQTHTVGIKPKIHWNKNATYEGSNETFTDKDFHSYLSKLGVERYEHTEWFKIDPDSAKLDFNDFRENRGIIEGNQDPIFFDLGYIDDVSKYFKNIKVLKLYSDWRLYV
ncbi:MAG: GIY-YIG nuclease family protein [Anaerococcus sp.]|nr:GIY-YIG nuclease family protein [Anaerococcus sp.]